MKSLILLFVCLGVTHSMFTSCLALRKVKSVGTKKVQEHVYTSIKTTIFVLREAWEGDKNHVWVNWESW